jgi:cell division septum initiation protein DivIVA
MSRVRDVLYRFRPVGAPGAASAAGVPVDRGADLAAELGPLFDLLADTERTCAGIVERAERDAAEVRARDVAHAREIVSSARARVDATRVDAAARIVQRDEAGRTDALAAAQRDAAELHDRAAERIPSYVGLVVASVDGLIGDEGRVDEPAAGAR